MTDSTSADSETVVGPVRVDEGAYVDEVTFDLTVLTPSGLSAFPRSRVVEVPAGDISDAPIEFTLIHDSMRDKAARGEPVRAEAGAEGMRQKQVPPATRSQTRLQRQQSFSTSLRLGGPCSCLNCRSRASRRFVRMFPSE